MSVAALLLACLPLAQEQAAAASSEPSPALARVVVIGASLSTGFGLEHTLADVLAASLAHPHAPLANEGDLLMFTRPLRSGGEQLERALDAEPTLVVALDFLFWFGYGTIGADGPMASEPERLAMLERGLALFAELECPLVLADFPDMSAAVGKMITKEQLPEKATLTKLSERVRAFAAARPKTLVLPFAELARTLKAEQEVHIGRHTYPRGSRLLQPDELHPTLEGMVAVGQLLLDELVKAELVLADEVLFERERVLARVREAKPQR
jgi:lysophospholipase L1-like esterase